MGERHQEIAEVVKRFGFKLRQIAEAAPAAPDGQPYGLNTISGWLNEGKGSQRLGDDICQAVEKLKGGILGTKDEPWKSHAQRLEHHTADELQALRLRILQKLGKSPPGAEQQELLDQMNAIAVVQAAMQKHPPTPEDVSEARKIFGAAEQAASRSTLTKYPRPRGASGASIRKHGKE